MLRFELVAAFVILTLSAPACAPTCNQVCTKILRCDTLDAELYNQGECELSCTRQLELYEDWEDEEKLSAFADHRRCLGSSTCDEIADGECYDDLIFVVD